MVSLKIIILCIILNIYVYLCESTIQDLTSAEVDGFIKTLDIRVIYFERKDCQAEFPAFLQEYDRAAKILHSYGVELAKVSCSIDKHIHCNEPADPSLFIFKDSKLLKSIPLSRVKNEPAIVANILHRFVLKDEVVIVQTEDGFKEILDEAKGKSNVILANVKSIGMEDHRNLLEVAFALGDSFKFYITTKLPVDLVGKKSKLKVFLCKEKDCEIRHYRDTHFKIIDLATFLQSVTLPGAIILGDDERSPYNKDTTFPINIVYIFEKNKKDIESIRQSLEEMAKSVKATVGIILVQVEKHLRFLLKFGLAYDSGFPAIGFIPSYKIQENDEMEHVDIFTSHYKMWQEIDTLNFIQELVKNPAVVYGTSVDTRSLIVKRAVEYANIVNTNEMQYLFVAFCSTDAEDCSSFIYDYQRLSRTFDRHFERGSAGKRDMQFAIIVCDDGIDPKFNVDVFPTVRLHKKDQSVTEYTSYTGIMNYYELLEFVKKSTGETYVLQLPSSGLDFIELDLLHEESKIPKVDEGSDDQQDSWNGYEKSPEETEDDEVGAAGYEMYFTRALNDEHVPKLNDTSFNITVQLYDIAVLFFFLPWDARCQAFTPSYGAVAKALAQADGSGTKIGVFQVNCYDWEDVCRKEGVLTYPTIRIYRKMKPYMDYHGVLDEPSLVRTIKLLLSPLPTKLTSDGEAVGFEVGKYPMPSILFTDVSVMGLFALESSEQVSIFETAARKMEGKDLFGYATGKVASDTSSRLGVSIPSIVLIKRNDPLQNKVIFQGDYTVDSIVDFVQYSSLPLYGELSPVNFPIYFNRNQPFLLVFKEKESSDVDSIIGDIIKSDQIEGVNFCWLDISLKFNRDILETYIKRKMKEEDKGHPTVVLVNHNEGKTYTYHEEFQKDVLISWIKHCLNQLQESDGELNQSEWKPRLAGYDFLAKMKEDEESDDNKDGNKDPWSSTDESHESEEDEEDDNQDENGETETNHDKDHNQRLHAAFHAKKMSRFNQRQHVVPDTPQNTHEVPDTPATTHNVHNEL